MNDVDNILYSNANPETKVYMIARLLHNNGSIPDSLWYAVLELKDKHLKDLQINWDTTGNPVLRVPLRREDTND